MAAVFAEESEEEGSEYVERGHAGGEHTHPENPGGVLIGGFENRILTIVAGGERKTRDRQAGA